MVGLKISSKEIVDIVKILGLEDDDQGKVYLSLLSLGMATLGQISLISGLDYLKTQEALKVLIGSNLVSRIPGKVGRYFAQEPFLKALSLAYDPITLINIRKEASNINEADSQRISRDFDNTVEMFRKNTSDLENDFSQSMNPMASDFKDLINNIKGELKSINNKNIEIIQDIDKSVLQAIEASKKLNEKIYTFHLNNLEKIPTIFETRIPAIRNELDEITQKYNEDLRNFQNKYDLEFKSLDDSVRNEITKVSENTMKLFRKIEDDRSEGYNTFKNKVVEINSSIDLIQLKANQSESKFSEIKDGYKEIDTSMRSFFTEIIDKFGKIEPVMETLIDDIRRRKLFKGKDSVLENLAMINEQKSEIQQIIEKNKLSLDQVNSLNVKLSEVENNLVNATKNGLQEFKGIVDTEEEHFSEIFQRLKENVNENIQLIQTDLEKQKLEMGKQIISINRFFDQKIDEIKNNLGSSVMNIVSDLSNLVNETSNDFKNDLSSFVEEEKNSGFTSDSLKEVLNSAEKMRSSYANDLERNLNEVIGVETVFKSYLAGLNSFTSNFAEVQVETFISTLNNAREIMNNRMKDFNKKMGNEISALTYSIKEMKLKLSKIIESSRLTEYSGIDSTLLTSDVVIGEPSIIMLLRDLTVRAKSSLTVLMPRPELQTMIAASKLPMRTRVSIIGDFRKVPESTVKKILSSGNVRLKQLDGIEFWGCIRDAEELLICPEPKMPEKEELLGVITTNENLVELFSKEIITYTTRSREIVL